MGCLGISVYPERAQTEEIFAYLEKAHTLGYKRLFTSLLEVKGEQEAVIDNFEKMISYAKKLGFQTLIDINPKLFRQLGISYTDLSFFHNLGVDGIRLDLGFTGLEEALMTRNPYGLKIEINMSSGTNYLENIMSYSPDRLNLLGCHNFYPQRYTGLGEKFFTECSAQFKKYSLHTAAFVSSASAKIGPWALQDGLPTLEEDRFKAIELQIEHLKSFGFIDDILIGNAFASESELKAGAAAFFAIQPQLHVELVTGISIVEKQAVLENLHLYRGDQSEYLIRDLNTRTKYAATPIKAQNNAEMIKRGDILLVNQNYGQYNGELQIALRDFPNDGRRNLVARIAPEDLFLLNKVQPWSTFDLKLR
ncbi:DUF871 domain-containing protein [Liquorilactobacillus oeni]|nr:MupG family TIM beta-alpha barrel fold protein [Liquorilactobacillus oeni]